MENMREFGPDDEDPVECRICGRPWEDQEAETCDGDCLEGTGTQAFVVEAKGCGQTFPRGSQMLMEFPEGPGQAAHMRCRGMAKNSGAQGEVK